MSAGNNMQRVFDTLQSSPAMMTVTELATVLHFTEEMALNAINRLRRRERCVCSKYDGMTRLWTYGIKPGSVRPDDYRGRKR